MLLQGTLAAAETITGVTPPYSYATGGAAIVVTGTDFQPEAGAVYTCAFQLQTDLTKLVISPAVAATSATQLTCVTPVWASFGAKVDFYLQLNGVEVGAVSV